MPTHVHYTFRRADKDARECVLSRYSVVSRYDGDDETLEKVTLDWRSTIPLDELPRHLVLWGITEFSTEEDLSILQSMAQSK